MASPDAAAESWEENDNLALDKLSLSNGTNQTPTAQRSQSFASSVEVRPVTSEEEAASRSSTQTCSSSSPPQPIIDPAVRDALISPKYRLQVLRFEADVENFVRQGGEKDLTFDASLTGYQRLLCHRVAQYYGLDTSTIDDGEDQGKILARRTLSTTIPAVRLADVKVTETRHQQRRVETPPRVLMKNRQAQDRARAAAGAGHGQGAGMVNSRTVQEREQDYSKARARIFAQEPSGPNQDLGTPDDGLRNVNGLRAPMMAPQAAGRGRAIPGRGDPGKKAVFRNREQDLQDPDYRRGYNSFGPRFDPGFGDMSGMQQGMYVRPTYNSEFPELGGGMGNRSMQGPFSQGPAPHSPAGAPGLMVAGPMHPDPSFMHPAMGAGGPFVPIPMQLLQGMPYAMMPGGNPIHALPPGFGMHPMQSMPGMFSSPPMAFPAMPMATPYGFMAPGQEGMAMHLGTSPTLYGGYSPHQLQFQMPTMSLEQMQQQQQQQHMASSNNARIRPSSTLHRRTGSGQQPFRSQPVSRPASAAAGPAAQAQPPPAQAQGADQQAPSGNIPESDAANQPELPALTKESPE